MEGRPCWNCGKSSSEEHFCPGCGKLQPHRAGVDYFGFFGLARKLGLDPGKLEKSFYALSRKLHPDNFYRASEREKQASLDKTAVLNDAYRTLKETVSRAQYLLELEGEKVDGAGKKVPPELLEEVFELNEWLAELRTPNSPSPGGDGHLQETRGRLEKARARFESQVEEFHQELRGLAAHWDRALEAGSPESEKRELLGKLGQALSRRNYLRNLLRDVGAALSSDEVHPGEGKTHEQAVPKLEIKLNSQ